MAELGYGPQTLWPDHCVQGTAGAALHPRLRQEPIAAIVRKGHRRGIDSYSAFRENDRATPTGLAGYLRECGVTRVFCAGLALDYCVRWSAEDARRLGFDALVVTDACRAIDREGSLDQALAAMAEAGVRFVTVAELTGDGG
jgi:nicotinamidase/pyrazinamidase